MNLKSSQKKFYLTFINKRRGYRSFDTLFFLLFLQQITGSYTIKTNARKQNIHHP